MYNVAKTYQLELPRTSAAVTVLPEPPVQESGEAVPPAGGVQDSYRYLLVLRFALVNLLAFGLLGAAFAHGLVERALIADKTHLVSVIFLVFLGGLVLCAWKVWQTSRELNCVRRRDRSIESCATPLLDRSAESRSNLVAALRLKLSNRIAGVRHIANSLVVLGLIGTVLGFIIALSGVDAGAATDVKSIAPMVTTLIEGMSTALYTTLVGAVLNIWLMVNHQLLAGGTVKLITACVEFAENDGRV